MRILIIGATGGTGRQLVTQALERGWSVSALVRSPHKLRLTHPNLTVIGGNVLDVAAVDRAVQGHDVVVSALGHKRWFYPNRILSRGTANIVEAMRCHGLRRLLVQSSLGVGNSFGRLGLWYTLFVVPVILPFYFWDKARQEAIVRASGLEWTIVRPGVLTNARRRRPARHGARLGNWIWPVRISRADVAGFLLGAVEARSHVRDTVAVAY